MTMSNSPPSLAPRPLQSPPLADVRRERASIGIGSLLLSPSGRLSRSEYWLRGVLALLPISILNSSWALLEAVTHQQHRYSWILSLLLCWPSFVLAVKRLHDRNLAGPWSLMMLIPVIGLYWVVQVYFFRGTRGENRFGPDPLRYVDPGNPWPFGAVRWRIAGLVAGFVVNFTLCVAICATSVVARESSAKEIAAKTDLAELGAALNMFEVDTGRYPTTEEGLRALVEQPSDARDWHGPYIKMLPKDPWGNSYIYCQPGTGGEDIELSCPGPDGVAGTADDIR